jgi:hypothetical protein
MLSHLQARELAAAGETFARSLGKPYAPAGSGHVAGIYRESVQLLSGRFAVVEKARDFTLVPWRPALDRELGKPVQGIMRGDTISWTIGRTRGPAIS